MFNSKKSRYGRLLSNFLCLFLFVIFTSPANAEEDYGNLPHDPNMSSLESVDLPFDPNDYTFLIYDPNGGQDSIEQAMAHLGIPYDRRGPGNEVTLEDLATHDILIVGWNWYGDTSGLHSDDLAACITGRVILSGHDLDYHTYGGIVAARTMFIQAIDYVLKGGGTGMITLGCTSAFPYLPKQQWDVNAQPVGGNIITEFTSEGLASGIYDGLTPSAMCNWYQSYHNIFSIGPGSDFVPFELGSNGVVTIARTHKISILYINKSVVDEPDFVVPGDYITYMITYGPNGFDHSNVKITDYLSCKVDYENLSDPNYDSAAHTYTWQIGSMAADEENNSVTLTVKVNESADPNGVITNYCEIESDISWTPTTADTNVGVWEPISDIVYVDRFTPCPPGTGLSWKNAYIDLENGLARARRGNVSQIKVAKGEYTPSLPSENRTFSLVDGVKMYGGYPSGGGLRNWLTNETILKWGQSTTSYVVTADGVGAETIIDGFTIKGASTAGVRFINNAEPVISHNKITKNADGINSESSNPKITNCIVCNNTYTGIRCIGAAPVIQNCEIYKNGFNQWGYGISVSSESTAIVRNNTIAKNYDYGIYFSVDSSPSISNCIIWYNKSGGTQINDFIIPTYSCIQGWQYGGPGNIIFPPLFVNADINDYHLWYNSPCIDAGDSNIVESDEMDIDGEPRRMGECSEFVDMGADESFYPNCWNCPRQCHADVTCDGVVNTNDWPPLADGWLSFYPQARYIANACADYNKDGVINTNDWPQISSWWLKSPPADCVCGCPWPPGECEGESGGEGKSTYSEEALEEMLKWLEEYQPPGWEEFIKKLSE